MDVKWASDVCVTQIYLNPDPPPAIHPVLSKRRQGSCALSADVMSLFCALHIKSFMEAIKCMLNGEELAE